MHLARCKTIRQKTLRIEERLFLSVVKSMTSFHVAEAQWDAVVFLSPVSQQSGMNRPGPLPPVAFCPGVALIQSSLTVYYSLFGLCPRCWLLPAFLSMRVP